MNKLQRMLAASLLISLSFVAQTKAMVHDHDIFANIDKMFSHPFFDKNIDFEDITRHKPLSKQLHEVSRKLHRAYRDAAQASLGSPKKALEFIEAQTKHIESLTNELRDGISKQNELSKYKIKESTSDDGKILSIVITIPGFDKNDLNITIDEKDDKKTVRTLTVTALKKEEKAKTKKSKKNDASVFHHRSESLRSASFINGRRQILEYDNGSLKVNIDLPNNIISEDYVMTFKDDQLKIEFPIKEVKEKSTRTLQFSKSRDEDEK